MCPYNPKPHGKKSAVDNFANIWMVDCAIIIFSMVCYNTYEYLQHDVFPLERLKKINCIMKKLKLFYYYSLIQKVWMFATWCIPSGATRRFSLKNKIYQLFKNRVLQCINFSTSFWNNFSKIYKILAVFVCFRESLDLRLELIYMMYDKLTIGWLISWT